MIEAHGKASSVEVQIMSIDTTPTATRLSNLEAVIEHGLETFVEVGRALLEIRDGRLYREAHGTFEEYCRERWRMSRQRAHQLIEASEVVGSLSTIVVKPSSEAVARELSALEPDQQREVWTATVERTGNLQPTAREVAETRESFSASDAEPELPAEEAPQEDSANPLAVHFSSDSEEWYTPAAIIDRVVEVFGDIDLDPCSNSTGNPNVPAAVHYTQEDNGLTRAWGGRVYMNPPYGDGIDDWAAKLCQEYADGRVTQAIALVPARTDTYWFRRFRDCAVCFVRGRLKFSGHKNSAPFPSAVVYLGPDLDSFANAFGEIGDVWVRHGS